MSHPLVIANWKMNIPSNGIPSWMQKEMFEQFHDDPKDRSLTWITRSDKKYGFFQLNTKDFEAVADELGLMQTHTDGIGYHRHPLAFLVEAADDICYTIIDFEDGINLGLIQEEFALEYLIKLVKGSINTEKYYLV